MKTKTRAAMYRQGILLAAAWSLVPLATLWADMIEGAASSPPSIATVQPSYGTLPLQFEANQGQVDAQVTFLARGTGYTLYLTPSESVLVLHQRESTREPAQRKRGEPLARPEPPASKQAVVRMTLEGANPTPAVDGQEPLPGIVNYFIGNDPAKWRTNIPTYAKVQYQEVYPGIDLAYYGNQGKLEYDFIVAPGADPAQIRLAFEGASDIHVADGGDLLLATALGDVLVQKPLVYQLDQDGHKTLVAGHYIVERQTADVRSASNPQSSVLSTRYSALPKIGIQLAAYDRTKPLVIDPVVLYSTYLGGSGYEIGAGIAVDGSGQAYVTGSTLSVNFPTLHASQPALGGGIPGVPDVFVTKFTASGALAYSTYLGGSAGEVEGGIAVDGSGQAYVTGSTLSVNFPTLHASQPALGGSGDAFVTKLTASGILAYSTYLGGGEFDYGRGIAVDGSGQAYVAGSTFSVNFPTLHASQPALGGGGTDAFVTKFTATGALAYSTYLGGSYADEGHGIAVDRSGQAYATGYAGSEDFPTLQPVQPTLGGGSDAFVTKLNATGSQLLYSTYLGGAGGDSSAGIAVDQAGQAYVAGTTDGGFPTVNPIPELPSRGSKAGEVFVTKLNATGSQLLYSFPFGGRSNPYTGNFGIGIAVDQASQAYVTGWTEATNFPTIQPVQPTNGGGRDAFVVKIANTSLVNDLVTLVPVPSTYRTTADPTGCPSGFVGTFSFHAWLTNKTSSPPLSDLAVHVKALSNGNLLQNATGGPGGVGSTLMVPKNHGYTDGTLNRGEFVDVHFNICLKEKKAFSFFVDVLGLQ